MSIFSFRISFSNSNTHNEFTSDSLTTRVGGSCPSGIDKLSTTCAVAVSLPPWLGQSSSALSVTQELSPAINNRLYSML